MVPQKIADNPLTENREYTVLYYINKMYIIILFFHRINGIEKLLKVTKE